MDLSAILSAAGGAAIALAGVGIAEFGQSRRARRSEDAALTARSEDRRAELWQISLPAAGRIQDLFATVIQLAQPPSPWQPDTGESFDDAFPEWWETKEQGLQRDIFLIPSPDFRALLTTASQGVYYGWALAHKERYSSSYRNAVLQIGRIGLEISSAWMRDEKIVDHELRVRIDAVATAARDVERQFRMELEEERDPKGYGPVHSTDRG